MSKPRLLDAYTRDSCTITSCDNDSWCPWGWIGIINLKVN